MGETGDCERARYTALPSWVLTQAAAQAHRLVADGLAAAGARGHHYRVLSVLEQYGPASQATLGRRSGVYLSDLVAALNELAHQGLVKRAPDPADRRRNTITLTPAGQQRLREMDEQMARIQEELLAPLLPSERLEITRLLSKVLHHHASPSIAPSTAPTAW